MENIVKLDARLLEPKVKHQTIFQKFDALAVGESFILVNDHDPKPLYYQFVGMRQGQFSWNYVMQGPEVWQVEIKKIAAETEEETIGEITARDFRKADVFKKYGIDFCCGGNKKLSQACDEKGIAVEIVKMDLDKLDQSGAESINRYDTWELDFLTDYIVMNHHAYLKKELIELPPYVEKIANVHGTNHPELLEIAAHFSQITAELISHLPKEEQILFPRIKQLIAIKRGQASGSGLGMASIQGPVSVMEREHVSAGSSMEEINRLSKGYSVPEDGCNTYKLVYQKLKEFEEDLHQHIHLENNILFPKAIELEKELIKSIK
ncbi:MAG: iron-sulfur cluster repair di-iron protein [Calditrichaceae bacterium]